MTTGDPISKRNIAILACGLVLFIAVIFIELRQKHPTLDLTLFKIKSFAIGNLTGFLNSLGFSCGPFLRSLYLQLVLGYSALKTGILLIPMEIVIFAVSPISGRLADRYGSRALSSIGLALDASALIWFSTLTEKSSYSIVLVSMLLFGFGMALFASPNTSSVMGLCPRGEARHIKWNLHSFNANGRCLKRAIFFTTDDISDAVLSAFSNSQQLATNQFQ